MVATKIFQELQRTLIRYRAGLIDTERCKQELAILVAMLRASQDMRADGGEPVSFTVSWDDIQKSPEPIDIHVTYKNKLEAGGG